MTTVTASSDPEDDLMTMIHKLTEPWEHNEVFSIRIPVVLDNITARMDEPDLPMHLFPGFNHTTAFRHGLRGALGLPRKSETRIAIELLTTRTTADQWAVQNKVPPTDLLRALPPATTPAAIRSEIRKWFLMHTPTDAADWTSKDSHGTQITEALQYALTVYTYKPALPTMDSTGGPDGPTRGQQDGDAGQRGQQGTSCDDGRGIGY